MRYRGNLGKGIGDRRTGGESAGELWEYMILNLFLYITDSVN